MEISLGVHVQLSAVEVIRYLRADRSSFYSTRIEKYGEGGGVTYCFRKALDWKTLRPADVSRLTADTGHEPTAQLKRYVNEEKKYGKELAKLFGFDIRSCNNFNDVDQKIDWKPLNKSSDALVYLQPGGEVFAGCREERRAARQLLERLSGDDRPLLYENSDIEVGFLPFTTCLVEDVEFSKHYSKVVYLLHNNDNFMGAIEALAAKLGLDAVSRNARALIAAARKERFLLIFSDCAGLGSEQTIRRNNPLLLFIFQELISLRNVEEWSGPALVLASGSSEWLSDQIPETHRVLEVVSTLGLTNPREGLRRLLYSQWERFCRLRKVSPYADIGSRLKRTQWHYAGAAKLPVYPINVRTRALFASNLQNQSYFDPTIGFIRLAGMRLEHLPLDIRLYHYVVSRQLEALKANAQGRRSLRAIQYVSTACYWLTHDGMVDFSKQFRVLDQRKDSKPVVSSLELEPVLASGSPFHHWVRLPSGEKAGEGGDRSGYRYVMSVAIKAIVQDAWQKEEPIQRAIAQYRVAVRLRKYRMTLHENSNWLTKEFPFQPNWGHEDIFLVAETIRHAVRSVGRATVDANFDPTSVSEFFSPPTWVNGGTDPTEVINYCYGTLYRKELNHNIGNQQAKRITTSHGAYVLAKELLQMMSHEKKGFGYPHSCLDEKFHALFLRDCGYVALGVGDIPAAVGCFVRLVRLYQNSENDRHLLDARLSLALALGVADRLEGARRQLSKAEEKAANVIRSSTRRDALWYRLEARKAVLAYIDSDLGDPDVFEKFKAIDHKSPIEEAELLRMFVISMEATQKNENTIYGIEVDTYNDPFTRCLTAVLEASNDGRHHDAMGLKVLLASLFRRRGMLNAAEALLDQVYADLRDHGGAERTMLRFLLEAGCTLIQKGKNIVSFDKAEPLARAHFVYRAYTIYLQRCLRRAEARGFVREGRAAKQYSVEALKFLKEDMTGLSSSGWREFILQQQKKQDEYLKREPFPSQRTGYSDPLWGFSMREEYGVDLGPTSMTDIDKALCDFEN